MNVESEAEKGTTLTLHFKQMESPSKNN